MVDFESLLLSYDKKISEVDGRINSKATKITEKNKKIKKTVLYTFLIIGSTFDSSTKTGVEATIFL